MLGSRRTALVVALCALVVGVAWWVPRGTDRGVAMAARGADRSRLRSRSATRGERFESSRPGIAGIFDDVRSAVCRNETEPDRALSADDAESLAREQLAASRTALEQVQAGHPWLARPSPAVCAQLDRWLARTGSEMEPTACSAAVALAFATASSPPCCSEYLHRVLSEDDPRFRALRFEALRAAVEDPDVEPALLMRFALSDDVREAQLSIATLARRDDASVRLAEILEGYEGGVPEELAHAWTRALMTSPALGEEDFVRRLLTRDPTTARCAIKALAQAPRSAAFTEPIAAMLDEHRATLPPAAVEREELVMALANAGPAGLARVRVVLEDPRTGVAERLMAVQMLKSAGMPRAEAAERALAILPLATAPDDVLTVVEVAIRQPQLREPLILALRAWAARDPDRAHALRETLETATMRPVRELAAWL